MDMTFNVFKIHGVIYVKSVESDSNHIKFFAVKNGCLSVLRGGQ